MLRMKRGTPLRALLLALGLGLFATGVVLAAAGDITTVAGTTAGFSGDGGAATSAQLNLPTGVAFDSAGNLFIADRLNHRIRKVDTSGNITTVAGNGTAGFSGDGGAATSAQLFQPHGLTFDSSGNLFIADTRNNRIRKVDTSGNITTVAGTGTGGASGDDGPAITAQFFSPSDVAFDSAGNLFIADKSNNRIRKVDTSGIITKIAGGGISGFSGDGGPATAALLSQPHAVVVDSSGNVFIADFGNFRIRKVDTSGNISTVAGGGGGFPGAGPATSVTLGQTRGVTFDSLGNFFISTSTRVLRVDTSGNISHVAGDGTSGFSGDGGAATSAQLSSPSGVAVGPAGDLFIADFSNHRIRKVAGVAATTLAADLSIAKSANPTLVAAAANLTYTLTATNAGPDAASNVTVTDTLPGAVAFVSASAGCSESGGTVTCTTASLANGENVQFSITVTAPGTGGSISNTASVTSSVADLTSSNDSVTLVTTVLNPPGVPGLTTWGLVALALGLAALVLVARRRRAALLR